MKLPPVTHDPPLLPPRPPTLHKGQAGHVAIIAGCEGMSGAAVLCGLGALRGGAGLVRVCVPRVIQPLVAVSEPSLMALPVADTEAGHVDDAVAFGWIGEVLRWANALAVGPGLGMPSDASSVDSQHGLLPTAFTTFAGPLILDADALNRISDPRRRKPWNDASRAAGAATILTPHPGEMRRLRTAVGLGESFGDEDEPRAAAAHELAAMTGAIVVLKGHRTVVADGARLFINLTGNAGMATGGMGDVLTGLIAALCAQGLPAFNAACLGVWSHGLAADFVAERMGPRGYLAREVADAIPAALARAELGRIGFR